MNYLKLVNCYQQLEKTTKILEKTYIISEFLKEVPDSDTQKVVYLLQGKVFPIWDERKIGMSSMLIIKALSTLTSTSKETIEKEWKKLGDLGLVTQNLIQKNKQTTLAKRSLTIEHVFTNLQKLAELQGQGTINRKIQLVNELLSNSSPLESKFIVKTILEELRIGVAEGILRDAIVWSFFPKVIGIFFKCPKCEKIMPKITKCLNCFSTLNPKFKEEIKNKFPNKKILEIDSIDELKNFENYDLILVEDENLARNVYNKFIKQVQHAYDLSNDFSEVMLSLKKGIKYLSKVKIEIGKPINPMLAVKAKDIDEAFEALGKPLQIEQKLDGFRLQVHKQKNKYYFYTRHLENVTKQFQELIPLLEKNVKGDNYILDTEVIGYDPKTGKYLSFQHMSQRIKRKYDIEKISKEIPVEINVFDILYYNNQNFIDKTQKERRDILEKIITQKLQKIVLTKKVIAENKKEVEDFYNESLQQGNEGIMLKNLNKSYTPGRRVGGWLKLKPSLEPLDLVIVKATYGEGKRAKALSSFSLACLDKNTGKFLECGKLGTGIKEKKSESGITFKELTKLLKPLIEKEKGREVFLKPEIVIEVSYEEIQKSPTYESGFALRFPRLNRLRSPEKGPQQANTIDDIKRIFKIQKKGK